MAGCTIFLFFILAYGWLKWCLLEDTPSNVFEKTTPLYASTNYKRKKEKCAPQRAHISHQKFYSVSTQMFRKVTGLPWSCSIRGPSATTLL